MSSDPPVRETIDSKSLLSTLWIFALLNYLYADFVSLLVNPAMQNMAKAMTEGVVLAWAVVMETAIVMVLLSRILAYGANRWANIVVGVLHTATVAWSLSRGVPQLYYIFFAVVEMACTMFIVWYAWRWRMRPQAARH